MSLCLQVVQSYYYILLFSYIGLLIGNLFFIFPVFAFAFVLAYIVLCIACIGNVLYISLLVNYNACMCYYIFRIALELIIQPYKPFLYLFKYNHPITSHKTPYGANKRILFIGTYVCMYLFLLPVLIHFYIQIHDTEFTFLIPCFQFYIYSVFIFLSFHFFTTNIYLAS